jgi:transposase
MCCKFTNISKEQIENIILPFIPKNKRGFPSRFNPVSIVQCIIHKLKTGCQWSNIFADIEGVSYPFSYQTVFYFYKKWCKAGVWENIYLAILEAQKDKLDTEKLNLDGTHTLSKKGSESTAYQPRKRGRTSNILVLTDGKGIPIAIGPIVSGNHNDFFNVVPVFGRMIRTLKSCNICVENSILNADKGFDSKRFRRSIQRRKMLPNIKVNKRNRKKDKRGVKRYFNQKVYNTRFVNERAFAWMDSFRTLQTRYDTSDISWINWHFIAISLILLKV